MPFWRTRQRSEITASKVYKERVGQVYAELQQAKELLVTAAGGKRR